MTNHEQPGFHSLLASLSGSDAATTSLPLASQAFWLYVLELAGKNVPGSEPPAIAERLLQQRLEGEPAAARQSAAITSLTVGEVETRRRAMRLLLEAGAGSATMDAAKRATGDPDGDVGAMALRLLVRHQSSAAPPALLDALESRFDLRETVAADALVDIGPEAVPGLSAMLEHGDARVRWRAARCLTRIAQHGHGETLTALIRAFHDDSPDVDWVAADGLVALGPSASIPVLRSVLAERLTGGTIKALHLYAQHASPQQVFRPLADATRRPAGSAATLVAVDKALRSLQSGTR
jgi:hypothetical protein